MPKPETISSAANPLLKDVRRAIARGGLTAQGWCVAETIHLLEEALRGPSEVMHVLASESAHAKLPPLRGARLSILPDDLLQKTSGTPSSQGVITLVAPPHWGEPDVLGERPLVVILDGVQDPGNAGAIVRSAEAFGATGAMFLTGSASCFNPKTLRASAGSMFRVPFLMGLDGAEAIDTLAEHRVQIYAAVAAHSTDRVRDIADVDLAAPCALIIGSEGSGVRPELRALSQPVSIPTVAVESLNAAMAAGILLYEARRQRGLRL